MAKSDAEERAVNRHSNEKKGRCTMTKTVSRRDFLVGSGVLGSAVALAGLSGCSPNSTGSASHNLSATSSEEGISSEASKGPSRLLAVDESDVARTEECDVVVCGSGSAGTYAAIRSAELGARVIWLEKTNLKGGTSTVTEGTLAYNTKEQVEAGVVFEPQEEFVTYMKWPQLGCLWSRRTELFRQFGTGY